MKVIIHSKQKVLKVISLEDHSVVPFEECHLVNLVQELSKKFSDEVIGWCEEYLLSQLSQTAWESIFHHELIMASYSVSGKFKINPGIGYVENSPFLKINFSNTYPTWLMSTDVGGISSRALNQIDRQFFEIKDFSFFLNTIAKLGQVNQLFCYSEPNLINRSLILDNFAQNTSAKYLFKFVKQNYRLQWIFVLFLSFLIFEKRLYLFPLLHGLRFKSNRKLKFNLGSLNIQSTKGIKPFNGLDVIIPTLGRKETLFQVLKDLSCQTIVPSRIVIVEQNPNLHVETELDFIYNEAWPFKIIHLFTHELGACRARNWALENIKSEWVFFSDDDIRIQTHFIEKAFISISKYGTDCITFSCVKNFGEGILNEKINQSTVFGSGNSFVKASFLKDIRFSTELEFGYGEDMDFGIQLRKAGVDVIHFPSPQIHHLKAPVGGFRTKFKTAWEHEGSKVQPAPTVLWIKKKHFTREQFLGYKMFYFISQIQRGNYNLYALERRWRRSMMYAQKL